MIKNLALDAQLSKDSYGHNNTVGGEVEGWIRLSVDEYKHSGISEVNFYAQFYKDANSHYKIAYRGAENFYDVADSESKNASLTVLWTPDMAESVKFTYYAIKEIQKLDPKLTFNDAKERLYVTGHRLGGFKAEFNAQLFGLNGTSLDGPGADHVKNTKGWAEIKAWIKSKEPHAKLDGGMGDFFAHQYSINVGGSDGHFEDVKKDTSGILLMKNVAMPALVKKSMRSGMQTMIVHEIDLIVYAEMSKKIMVKVAAVMNAVLDDLIFKLQQSFNTAQITQGPIILDLAEDGEDINDFSTRIHLNKPDSWVDKLYGFPESGNYDDESFLNERQIFGEEYAENNFDDCDEDEDEYSGPDFEKKISNIADEWCMTQDEWLRLVCALLDAKNVDIN